MMNKLEINTISVHFCLTGATPQSQIQALHIYVLRERKRDMTSMEKQNSTDFLGLIPFLRRNSRMPVFTPKL